MTSAAMFNAKYCNRLDWAVRHKQFRKKNYRSGSYKFFLQRKGLASCLELDGRNDIQQSVTSFT